MKKSKELIKSVRNTHKHLRTIKAFFKEAGEKFTGLSKFMSKQITKLKSNPDVFDCFNRFLGFHQSYLEKYNNYFEFLGSSFTQKHSYLKAYGAELKNMSKVEDEVERVIEEIYYSKGKITAEEEESKLDEANKKLLFCSVNSLDEIGDQLIESFVDLMQVIFIRENTHELENRMIIQHNHIKKLRKLIHENVSDSSEALMDKLNIYNSDHNLKLIGYRSQLDPLKLEDLVLKKMDITKRNIAGLTSITKKESIKNPEIKDTNQIHTKKEEQLSSNTKKSKNKSGRKKNSQVSFHSPNLSRNNQYQNTKDNHYQEANEHSRLKQFTPIKSNSNKEMIAHGPRSEHNMHNYHSSNNLQGKRVPISGEELRYPYPEELSEIDPQSKSRQYFRTNRLNNDNINSVKRNNFTNFKSNLINNQSHFNNNTYFDASECNERTQDIENEQSLIDIREEINEKYNSLNRLNYLQNRYEDRQRKAKSKEVNVINRK